MQNNQELKHAQTYINSIKEDFTQKVATLEEMKNAIDDIPTLEKFLADINLQVENEANNKWWKKLQPFSFYAKRNALNNLLEQVKHHQLSPALERGIEQHKLLNESDKRIFYVNLVPISFIVIFGLWLMFGMNNLLGWN